MEFFKNRNFIVLLIVISLFISGFFLIFINNYQYIINNPLEDYKTDFLSYLIEKINNLEEPPKKLENPPSVIKAVYVTAWSAGSKSYLNYLNEIFKTTQINAVVIDIKDVSGFVYYKTGLEKVKEYGNYRGAISSIDKLVRDLHNKGIYVIARLVVFKDYSLAQARPDLAVFDKTKTKDKSKPVLWQDKNGMYWVDPSSKEVQDYNISLAKDALAHGFDEINFDYIRFPSDGKLKDMDFPFFDSAKTTRRLVIKDFSRKIRDSLPNDKISVDLFGLTTVSVDDMGVGQVFEDSFDYFDYTSPMLYSSHYASGFIGYKNPAEYPYEVVKYSMDGAILKQKAYAKLQIEKKKLAQIRPWLQDFDLGADYNEAMVRQEIKAVTDSTGKDFIGFMLWNPLNIYTKEAIILENTEPK